MHEPRRKKAIPPGRSTASPLISHVYRRKDEEGRIIEKAEKLSAFAKKIRPLVERLATYENDLRSEARRILDERSKCVPSTRRSYMGEPEKTDELILRALEERGRGERIVASLKRESGTLYIIDTMGSQTTIPVANDILETEDPAAKIRTVMDFLCSESKRPSAASASKSPEDLGISSEQLISRSVAYDGPIHGKHHFTYWASEIGNSFVMEERGKDLLSKIDRKILSMHRQWGERIGASVVEAMFDTFKFKPLILGLAADEMRIARVLHNFSATETDHTILPQDYVQPVEELSLKFKGLRGIERMDLDIDIIDHPANLASQGTDDPKALVQIIEYSIGQGPVIPFSALEHVKEAALELAGFVSMQDDHVRQHIESMIAIRRRIEKCVSFGMLSM